MLLMAWKTIRQGTTKQIFCFIQLNYEYVVDFHCIFIDFQERMIVSDATILNFPSKIKALIMERIIDTS